MQQSKTEDTTNTDNSEGIQLSETAQQLTTAKTEITDLKQQLEEKHSKMTQLTMTINELHIGKKDLDKKVGELKENLKSSSSHLNEVRREKSELEKRCEQLESEVAINLEEVKRLSEASFSTAVTQKELGNMKAEKDDLQQKFASLQAEFETLSGELQRKESENEQLTAELTSKNHMLDSISSEKQEFTLQLENISKEKEQMEAELEQLKNEIQTIQSNHKESTEEQLQSVQQEWQDKMAAERSAMIAVRESVERELTSTEQQLNDKVRHYESYISELEKSRQLDTSELQSEHERVVKICHEKDGEISKLEGQLQQVKSDMEYNKDMLQTTIDGQSHITNLLSEKDAEIDVLKSENRCLQESTEEQENVIKHHEAELSRLGHTERLYKALVEENKRLKVDLDDVKKKLKERETEEESKQIESKTLELITVLEKEVTSQQQQLESKDEIMQGLRKEISDLTRTIDDKNSSLESSIKESEMFKERLSVLDKDLGNLQKRNNELNGQVIQKTDTVKNLENVIENLKHSVFTKESALKESSEKIDALTSQMKSSSELVVHSNDCDSKLQSVLTSANSNSQTTNMVKHINSTSGPDGDQNDMIQIENLKQQIEERDSTISVLKDKNTVLSNLLEERSKSVHGDATLVDIHRLEGEVKSLRMEKEQMMQVLNDKTRECSQLKGEVHKLMNVVSAEKAALSKLQQDNQQLKEQETEKPNQDMGKEAIKNLSRMIRDKDLEIESLNQKNTTLLQVGSLLNHIDFFWVCFSDVFC